ncbi:MAG: succinylglutamate desuccinylase/aspartoacylase family protein [Acidobacteria bacterium]|nr:succinylglutamate desuccinylase/aspartoacylase family protein [Acidobacteriota bacterium]
MQPTSEAIPVRTLPSGHVLTVRSFRFSGCSVEAPRVYIQAGVHGTEVQGTAVVAQLLAELSNLPQDSILGEIVLVPNANPHGLNSKSGEHTVGPFDPATGLNWNRAYSDLSSLEPPKGSSVSAYKTLLVNRLEEMWSKKSASCSAMQRHAFSLQRMAQRADIVLDLHTSARGNRYVYGPAYAQTAMAQLNVTDFITLSGRCDGALDEAISCPWIRHRARLGSDSEMPFGLTLELGDQEQIDLEEAKRDAQGILSLLRLKGVLTGPPQPLFQTFHVASDQDFHPVYAPSGGLFQFEVQPGSSVRAGDRMGTLLRLDGAHPQLEPVHAPKAGRVLTQYPSAICHQGVELYKILGPCEVLSFVVESPLK